MDNDFATQLKRSLHPGAAIVGPNGEIRQFVRLDHEYNPDAHGMTIVIVYDGPATPSGQHETCSPEQWADWLRGSVNVQ